MNTIMICEKCAYGEHAFCWHNGCQCERCHPTAHTKQVIPTEEQAGLPKGKATTMTQSQLTRLVRRYMKTQWDRESLRWTRDTPDYLQRKAEYDGALSALDMLEAQGARIAELEAQLAAALATIERATWCEACGLPAEHCRENH